MKKNNLIFSCLFSFVVIAMALVLNACGNVCQHEWEEATCETPKTCSLCGVVEGQAPGHMGGTATCYAKAVCDVCHEEYGELSTEHTGEVVWFKLVETHYEGYSCCGTATSEEEAHHKVLGVCTICGFDPTIEVSSVTEENGQYVLKVSVVDNPGITGLELSVTYDDNAMTLVSASNGSALDKLMHTAPQKLASGCKFLWDGEQLANRDIKHGEILTLVFDINENATNGEYAVLLQAKGYDNNLAKLTFKIVNGIIVISK